MKDCKVFLILKIIIFQGKNNYNKDFSKMGHVGIVYIDDVSLAALNC